MRWHSTRRRKNDVDGQAQVKERPGRLRVDEALIALLIGAMNANDHVSPEEGARAHHIIWSMRRFRRKPGEAVERTIEQMRALIFVIARVATPTWPAADTHDSMVSAVNLPARALWCPWTAPWVYFQQFHRRISLKPGSLRHRGCRSS